MRTLRAAILACLSFLVLAMPTASFAQVHDHAAEQQKILCDQSVVGKKPGDYGFMHPCFDPIYSKIKRWDEQRLDWISCCSGSECRVTELVSAPVALKLKGYDGLVLMDGAWFPYYSRIRITLTQEQLKMVRSSKTFGDFFAYSHICGGNAQFVHNMGYTRTGVPLGPPAQKDTDLPARHCIVDASAT